MFPLFVYVTIYSIYTALVSKSLSSLLCRRRTLSRAKQAACYKVWTCSDAKKVTSDAVGDHRFLGHVFLLLIWTRTTPVRTKRT